MDDMTILCYLDVLGYSEFVRRHYDNESVREGIEKIFQSCVQDLKDLKQKEIFDDPDHEKYAQHVFKTLRVRFISDSLIYTLALSKVPAANTANVEGRPLTTYCFHVFFRLISMFCTTFIGKTGLVIRGGITIGPHYERDWEEDGAKCLFVFSKALVDAVDLEKREANIARIVVDERLIRYLREKTDIDIDKFTFKDPKVKRYLEQYNIFRPCCAEFSEEVLQNIKEQVTGNMAASSSDPRKLEKLQDFAEYHNARVQDLNMKNLIIDYPGKLP